jgi:hypothetical protein
MTKASLPLWVKTELGLVEAAQAKGLAEQATALRAQSARYDSRKNVL